MPESNGLDIMDDICHFWKWIRSDLPDYLTKSAPGIDLSKAIAYGDSAGGYLAIQSGLRQPFGTIKQLLPHIR
jgi:acetyl esterase/lipase